MGCPGIGMGCPGIMGCTGMGTGCPGITGCPATGMGCDCITGTAVGIAAGTASADTGLDCSGAEATG